MILMVEKKREEYRIWVKEAREIFDFIFYFPWKGLIILGVFLAKFLTRFWPFSLFWTDKMFHYRYRFYLKTLKIIEKEAERLKMQTSIVNTEEMANFICYHCKFSQNTFDNLNKDQLPFLSAIEKRLNFVPESIYLHDSKEPLTKLLLIPSNYLLH